MNNQANQVLQIRVPRAMKRSIALIAADRGVRINQIVREALAPVIAEAEMSRITELDARPIAGSKSPEET